MKLPLLRIPLLLIICLTIGGSIFLFSMMSADATSANITTRTQSSIPLTSTMKRAPLDIKEEIKVMKKWAKGYARGPDWYFGTVTPVPSDARQSAISALSVPTAGPNLITNPSFEQTDAKGQPVGWFKGRWGTHQAVFSYPVAGFTTTKGAKVSIAPHTSGDAKWYFSEVSVTPGQAYLFSNYSMASIDSWITVRFKRGDGTYLYTDIGHIDASPSSWQLFETAFTVPQNVVSLTIFHLIKKAGNLTVDEYSLSATTLSDPAQFDEGIVTLTLDDGWKTTYQNALPIITASGLKSSWYIITGRFLFPNYMNQQEVLAVQQGGHEIGAHTRTHPDLTTLSTAQMQSEIIGSKDDLLGIGVNSVTTFAYPFGAYNTMTDAIVRPVFSGVRTSDGGTTQKNDNPYLLERQSVELVTTFSQVKEWIDAAVQNKHWQILLFHRVDASGTQYSVTPALFQQIVDYLVANNIRVVTLHEGVLEMN